MERRALRRVAGIGNDDAPASLLAQRPRPGPGLLRPSDAGYEAACGSFNTRLTRRPWGILFADTPAHVAEGIALAARTGVPLRARSGRHSYEAYSSVDGGLVVDVSLMDGAQLDASGNVTVGAGTQLLPLYEYLSLHGVAVPGGSCATVGVAGIALGGGYGLLSRHAGLLCDRLVSADIVTARGDLLTADDRQHADLFWALRGAGGGNFGVVTALRFATIPMADVSVYTMMWNGLDAAGRSGVIDAWQDWAPSADPRVTSVLLVSRDQVIAAGWCTEAASILKPLLQPFEAQAKPHSSPVIVDKRYIAAARQFAGVPEGTIYQPGSAMPPHSFKYSSAFVYNRLPRPALTLLAKSVDDSRDFAVHFDAFGGAIANVPRSATAFVHRNARFSIQYQADIVGTAHTDAATAWVRRLRAAMEPYTSGAYANYVDDDLGAPLTAYYAENLSRLRAVKQSYDPGGLFAFRQGV